MARVQPWTSNDPLRVTLATEAPDARKAAVCVHSNEPFALVAWMDRLLVVQLVPTTVAP